MDLTVRNNRKHSIVFIILIFYMLFSPPILGIHSLYFVTVFSWGYLIINHVYLMKDINWYSLQRIGLALFLLFVWTAFIIIINNGTKSVVFHYIYWIFAIFPGALSIGVHTKKHNESFEYILRLVLWAAFIQSLFSVLAFANNDFKMLLINRLQSDNTLDLTRYTNEINYRLFGYSAGMTFDMPSAMSLIACVAIFFSIKKNLKYLLFVPTICFSAVINARTSMIVLAIGIIVILLANEIITWRAIRRIVFIILIALLLLIVGIAVLHKISPLTYGWVKSGASQIIGLFHRESESGYFNYLFNSNRWKLPSGLALFFGTGIRVMGGSKYGVFSDVGYINDIWFGGILYTIVLYYLVMLFVWRLSRKQYGIIDDSYIRFVSIVYLICLPILNVKTYIVALGSFTTLFIILAMYPYAFYHRS